MNRNFVKTKKRRHQYAIDELKLTPRQLEVLSLVMEGHTNKWIGILLGISGETVKNHVSEIMLRLNAPDRTAAVVFAVRLGFLELRGSSI